VRVRSVLSVAIIAGASLLPVSSARAVAGHSPGGSGTDVVMYECTSAESVEVVRVRVELTMPTAAQAGTQLTIGWRGTYDGTARITAPPGGLSNGNLYAYVSISGMPGLTSATGVGALPKASYAADEPIELPSGTVELKTTPNQAGTATVRPAAINFGTRPNDPVIECEVEFPDALRTYTLTIGGQGAPTTSPSATPSTTPSVTPSATATSPRPTATVTRTVTAGPDPDDTGDTDVTGASGRVARTPVGSAATGGGGEAGPDARLITLAGLLLTFAGAGGLVWRQRRLRRT
jgi:Predicted solute binding protein